MDAATRVCVAGLVALGAEIVMWGALVFDLTWLWYPSAVIAVLGVAVTVEATIALLRERIA